MGVGFLYRNPKRKLLSINLKDLIKISQPAAEKLSTTLFGKMKSLLSLSGDVTKAREFYGIHKVLSRRMLKFDIHKGKKEMFDDLAYRTTYITVMSTNTKKILSMAGYFRDVLK